MKPIHLLSENKLRGCRAFCGDGFPWPWIADLSDGDEVTACYVVHERRRALTKRQKPYLTLTLGDRTGTIEAKVWDDVERWEALCDADGFIGVHGQCGLFRDEIQLTIRLVEPLHVDGADLEFFLPASPRDRDGMERELNALLGSVEDVGLHALLRRCLGKKSSLGRAFRVHPAAKRNHHAYLGGLLEHSLSVAAICDRLAEHYHSLDAKLDRDLLITGALLHDVGKIRELRSSSGFGYTTEGQLLGHIVIGIQVVGRAADEVDELSPERLLLLQHLIASHQGKPEWNSPRVPQMLEAMLLHYADDLDSKMNPVAALLAGVPAGGWSDYHRGLARSFFQPPALPAGGEVEPVAADEAVELMIDFFR